jgi:NADH:ubiquinone oxidoreductase subunit 5 (subunit L)/multisubunit Na+/H+ antiporter MnhA subunit
MIVLVVGCVFCFKRWYMINLSFRLFMVIFIVIMLFVFFSSNILFIFRWERVGLMSLLLISFLRRHEGISSSVAAVMYNRLRDLGVMLYALGINL